MQHHWSFLEEKLGKDIVKYCMQPFLLPVNGWSIEECKWKVLHELKFFLNAPRMRYPLPSDIKLMQNDPNNFMYSRAQLMRRPWMRVGTPYARSKKEWCMYVIATCTGRPHPYKIQKGKYNG
jgi:hypothetical protein